MDQLWTIIHELKKGIAIYIKSFKLVYTIMYGLS